MGAKKRESNATAGMLVRKLKRCPACKGSFTGHHYAAFATTPLGESRTPKVLDFLKALKDHRWADLQMFQDWESTSDDLEAYVVRCTTGEIVLAIVRSPEEFWDSDQLVDIEPLTLEESGRLGALIENDKWLAIM